MQEQVLKEGYDPAYGARPDTIAVLFHLTLSLCLRNSEMLLSRPLRRAITRMLEASSSRGD